MKNIEQGIKDITHQMFGINKEQIHMEARLKEDLGLDSLDAIQWVVELETQFNISIPDEEAIDFKKIAQVVSYIERHITKRSYTRKAVNQPSVKNYFSKDTSSIP